MSSTWKNNIEITIFGESHGKAIGIVLGNLPSGIKIDLEEVAKEMKRRAPGQDKMSTARKEADKVEIMSGLQDDVTTGAPLCGIIYNSDQHSKDYSLLKEKMRPGIQLLLNIEDLMMYVAVAIFQEESLLRLFLLGL